MMVSLARQIELCKRSRRCDHVMKPLIIQSVTEGDSFSRAAKQIPLGDEATSLSVSSTSRHFTGTPCQLHWGGIRPYKYAGSNATSAAPTLAPLTSSRPSPAPRHGYSVHSIVPQGRAAAP